MGSTALVRRPSGDGDGLARVAPTGSPDLTAIEYGGNSEKVKGFVSTGATRQALQMVGNEAGGRDPDPGFRRRGAAVLLGITERLEFVDAPGHVDDLKRDPGAGYAMQGYRIRIVTDRPVETVEVHPASLTP